MNCAICTIEHGHPYHGTHGIVLADVDRKRLASQERVQQRQSISQSTEEKFEVDNIVLLKPFS